MGVRIIYFVILGVILLMTSACANKVYVDYRNFRSIGFNQKIFGLENAGFVRSQDCSWTILGYNITSPPSFDDALENAASLNSSDYKEQIKSSFESKGRLMKTKVKLLTNVRTRTEGWNVYLIGRKCLEFSAIAYL